MKRHRGVCLALALCALIGLSAGQGRAGTITMTVQVGTGPVIDLEIFGGLATSNSYTMDGSAITGLNNFLTVSGSQYQFSTMGATGLGGTSNFPGSELHGLLTLSGLILSVGPGNPSLTITETESAFTAPTGPSGTLTSSSTGNFILQPAAPAHTASSALNSTSTPTYTVSSLGTGINPDTGMATAHLSAVPTLYTLTNTITFNLAPGTGANPVENFFSVIAAVTAVPEPASLVMMLTGIPVPLMLVSFLRRRRASA